MLSDGNSYERPFPIPREVIDTLNSISWFIMDSAWMLQWPTLAELMILPTVATGLVLLYVEKRRSLLLINVAICCWILMNTFWMLGDTHGQPALLFTARALFALGVLSVLGAAHFSEDLRETFSHFRRFRLMASYVRERRTPGPSSKAADSRRRRSRSAGRLRDTSRKASAAT
jgi:hypothetical protein